MNDTPSAPRNFLRALFTGAPPDDAAGALRMAAARAAARGYVVLPLGLQPATDTRELAGLHAAIALQSVRHGRPLAPTVILSAGPVLRAGAPAGAADFLLALALSLDEHAAIHATACGPAVTPDSAGAALAGFLAGPDTVPRALAHRLQPGGRLLAGEAPAFFAALGDSYALEPAPGEVLRAIFIALD
jgi:glycerate-2-kinase